MKLRQLNESTAIEDYMEFYAPPMKSVWIRREAYMEGISRGEMPWKYWHVFLNDFRQGKGPWYVIFSYATPIAWGRPDHLWRVPPFRYSTTTTRHQNTVLNHIGDKRVKEDEWQRLITSTA